MLSLNPALPHSLANAIKSSKEREVLYLFKEESIAFSVDSLIVLPATASSSLPNTVFSRPGANRLIELIPMDDQNP